MKRLVLFALPLCAVLSFPGCATRGMGRQSALTDYEKETMTCQDIDQEMNRAIAFIKHVDSGDAEEQHGPALVAALENHWIGNSLERSAAVESANARMIQLWALRDAKKCNTAVSSDVQSFPVQRPKVEEKF